MKYFSLLAILSAALLVSAAPCHEKHNHEDNSNHEINTHDSSKNVYQTIGSVGSNDDDSDGLLTGLLGKGLLSSSTTNNYVTQEA